MSKKIPKIYINKIDKINNNKEVYYSYKDDYEEEIKLPTREEINDKINKLFKSNDFVYKKKVYIKTKYSEGYFVVVSKNYDYLLTLTGEKIYISNILEIK